MTLPAGVYIRSPNRDRRGPRRHPVVERGLRAAPALGHLSRDRVRGHGDGRRLRRPQPELRRAGPRQHQPEVLLRGRHDVDQRLGLPHQEPVQGPPDRAQPPVPQRPDAEGRLHPERGQGHDDGRRGRLDRPHLEPPAQVRRQLHDRGLRPDPHRPAGRPLAASVLQGVHGGDQGDPGRLAAQHGHRPGGRERRTASAVPTARSTARAAAASTSTTAATATPRRWATRATRARPTGTSRTSRSRPASDYEGFGNTDRSFFRRPSVWNVDLSLYKGFQMGRVRPEIRVDVANLFNHPNWGAPVTTFTANNFLQFTPGTAPRAAPTAPARGGCSSACGWSSRRVLIVHARPARAGRA